MARARVAGWVAASATGVILAGCTTAGGTGSDPSTGSGTSTSARPTSTAPATTSPEDLAAQQAEPVLRAYYRAYGACLADPPNTPLTCIDDVAISTERNNFRNSMISAQLMHTHATGGIDVVAVSVGSVSLANHVDQSPPVVPTVTFRVCVDVSKLGIVDKDGKSVVPPERTPQSLLDVSVANYKYPDPTQWRVAYIKRLGPTC